MVFILMFIVFSFTAPNFLNVRNLLNVSRQINTLGICSVGMTLLLIAGSIDLSQGYQLSLINVFCAFLMVEQGIPMVLAILLSLVLGAIIGFINGIIDLANNIISGVASPVVGAFASILLDDFVSYLGTRDKAEFYAYNWYYFLFVNWR